MSKRAKYSTRENERRAKAMAKAFGYAKPGYQRTTGYYGRFSGPSAELKFFDTANSFTIDATGEVPATGQLTLIPQGVTESERVGRKCSIKSIHIRGSLVLQPAASANAATTVYVYLVQDTQCNGVAAAVTDVLETNTMASAMINLANSSRFRILKRFVMTFNSTAGVTTAYNNFSKPIEYYKKCNIPIEYSSTTGAITEIRSNNLFFLAGSDSLSDDLVSFNATTRLRFSDN